MRTVACVVVFFLAGTAWAEPNQADGCLARQSNQFVLLQGGRTIYQLQGDQNTFRRYAGEMVRLSGQLLQGANGSHRFAVSKLKRLGLRCVASVPRDYTPDMLTGKTGNAGDTVPVTTTATAGYTTPGVQTEAGEAQQPGNQSQPGPPAAPERKRPGAPPSSEQPGQSRQEANVNAEAVTRTEVEPGQALGTSPSAPESSGEPAPTAPPRTSNTQPSSTIQIGDRGCTPERLTVRPGEAVRWLNTSGQGARVQLQTVQGVRPEPMGAVGFDSGNLGAGQSFEHVFASPGTFRYTCTAGSRAGVAEVEVK